MGFGTGFAAGLFGAGFFAEGFAGALGAGLAGFLAAGWGAALVAETLGGTLAGLDTGFLVGTAGFALGAGERDGLDDAADFFLESALDFAVCAMVLLKLHISSDARHFTHYVNGGQDVKVQYGALLPISPRRVSVLAGWGGARYPPAMKGACA